MHCLMIYAHPDTNSYTGALRDAFLSGLKTRGHTYDLIDLYAEQFEPELPLSELPYRDDCRLSTPVLAYQEKVRKADIIAFSFPTWWQGPPAILKGFLDRVFTPGFAFERKGNSIKGLLGGKVAVILNGYNSPWLAVKIFSRDRAFKTIKYDVLSFCGIKKIFRLSVYKVSSRKTRYRGKMLIRAEQLGLEVAEAAVR